MTRSARNGRGKKLPPARIYRHIRRIITTTSEPSAAMATCIDRLQFMLGHASLSLARDTLTSIAQTLRIELVDALAWCTLATTHVQFTEYFGTCPCTIMCQVEPAAYETVMAIFAALARPLASLRRAGIKIVPSNYTSLPPSPRRPPRQKLPCTRSWPSALGPVPS